MEVCHPFQGVVCHTFDKDKTIEESIIKSILELELNPVTHHNVTCYELKLSNKYYETTIHLYDHESTSSNDSEILDRCQAIILHGDGEKMTVEQLNAKVDQFQPVSGGPRVLLYHNINDDCHSYKTLSDWSITNGYDFIDTSENDIQKLLIDSLSAYKWRHRMDTKPSSKKFESKSLTQGISGLLDKDNDNDNDIDVEDYKRQLEDFNRIFNKLRTFVDKPRGDTQDKELDEIAKLLNDLSNKEDEDDDN